MDNFYTWMKTEQVFDQASKIGAGMLKMGLVPIKGEHKDQKLKFAGFYA